jgi:FkbM family methyltransferase
MLVAVIRAVLRQSPPGALRNVLVGPVTSYLLPEDYRCAVAMPDGARLLGSPLDIVTRMILYFGASRHGCWEPCTTRLAGVLAGGGGDVIVGGAHVGFFAVILARAMAARGGRVFAFEPAPPMYAELVRNARLNDLPNLTLEPCALGSRSGSAEMYIQGVRSSLVKPTKGPTDRRHTTEVVAIDDYVDRHRVAKVSLLFLDIEGAELQALHGAERLLKRTDAPDVIFEIIPAAQAHASAAAYLTSLGYTILYVADDYELDLRGDMGAPRVRPIGAAPGGHRYFNALATRGPERLASLGVVIENIATAA